MKLRLRFCEKCDGPVSYQLEKKEYVFDEYYEDEEGKSQPCTELKDADEEEFNGRVMAFTYYWNLRINRSMPKKVTFKAAYDYVHRKYKKTSFPDKIKYHQICENKKSNCIRFMSLWDNQEQSQVCDDTSFLKRLLKLLSKRRR